ncbi:hypothetical protein BaRGS_00027233 [Batillaria attramentaria]|uniref:Secreted protein n=1 Tax=Batillaria attramentaria TaxID=370345 RepID=A0ABD0K2X1_9CAEN
MTASCLFIFYVYALLWFAEKPTSFVHSLISTGGQLHQPAPSHQWSIRNHQWWSFWSHQRHSFAVGLYRPGAFEWYPRHGQVGLTETTPTFPPTLQHATSPITQVTWPMLRHADLRQVQFKWLMVES